MRFVLQDSHDPAKFYSGGYETDTISVESLNKAVIFTLRIKEGTPVVEPNPPSYYEWIPQPVSVSLE